MYQRLNDRLNSHIPLYAVKSIRIFFFLTAGPPIHAEKCLDLFILRDKKIFTKKLNKQVRFGIATEGLHQINLNRETRREKKCVCYQNENLLCEHINYFLILFFIFISTSKYTGISWARPNSVTV